jgi:hypothetical protein
MSKPAPTLPPDTIPWPWPFKYQSNGTITPRRPKPPKQKKPPYPDAEEAPF